MLSLHPILNDISCKLGSWRRLVYIIIEHKEYKITYIKMKDYILKNTTDMLIYAKKHEITCVDKTLYISGTDTLLLPFLEGRSQV